MSVHEASLVAMHVSGTACEAARLSHKILVN